VSTRAGAQILGRQAVVADLITARNSGELVALQAEQGVEVSAPVSFKRDVPAQAQMPTTLNRPLSPSGFAWMAADNSVFVALMEETADRWGGKRFLKTVEESLEQETDAFCSARRELIRWFLDRK